MSRITKSASAAAARSPTEPRPPAVSVRLADVAHQRQLRVRLPDRVGVVGVQRVRQVGHRAFEPLVVVLGLHREGDEGLGGVRHLRVLHDHHRVGDVELGRLADRADRPQRVVHVVHDLLHLRVALGRAGLGGGVDRHAVVGQRDLAGQEGLVVEGVVPRRGAGDEGVDISFTYSSALTVSGELMITLSFLSTRLPPCDHSAQCTQALPSPEARPSAKPPGVRLGLQRLHQLQEARRCPSGPP